MALGDIPEKSNPFAGFADVVPRESGEEVITLDDRDAGRLESLAGGVAQGFGQVIASIPKAVGEISGIVTGGDADETVGRELGQTIDEFFADVTDINPNYRNDFSQQVASGLGQAAGFIAGGVAGNVLKAPAYLVPSLLGSSLMGVEQVDDYKRTVKAQGGIVDHEKRADSFKLGAVLGLSEGLPAQRALNRAFGGKAPSIPMTRAMSKLDSLTKGGVGRILRNSAVGGIEEATQEILQTIGSNYIASDIVEYDKDRNVFTGAKDAGEVGFTVGALLNGMLSSIGGRRGRSSGFQQLEDELTSLGADEDVQKLLNKSFNDELLTPGTNKDFKNQSAKSALNRYIVLDKLRRTQLDSDKSVEGTLKNMESLLADLKVTEEGVPLDPEVKEVLDFINKQEQLSPISEDIAPTNDQESTPTIPSYKETLDAINDKKASDASATRDQIRSFQDRLLQTNEDLAIGRLDANRAEARRNSLLEAQAGLDIAVEDRKKGIDSRISVEQELEGQALLDEQETASRGQLVPSGELQTDQATEEVGATEDELGIDNINSQIEELDQLEDDQGVSLETRTRRKELLQERKVFEDNILGQVIDTEVLSENDTIELDFQESTVNEDLATANEVLNRLGQRDTLSDQDAIDTIDDEVGLNEVIDAKESIEGKLTGGRFSKELFETYEALLKSQDTLQARGDRLQSTAIQEEILPKRRQAALDLVRAAEDKATGVAQLSRSALADLSVRDQEAFDKTAKDLEIEASFKDRLASNVTLDEKLLGLSQDVTDITKPLESDILTQKGLPYRQIGSASSALVRKKLKETHEVVQTTRGFVIREIQKLAPNEATIIPSNSNEKFNAIDSEGNTYSLAQPKVVKSRTAGLDAASNTLYRSDGTVLADDGARISNALFERIGYNIRETSQFNRLPVKKTIERLIKRLKLSEHVNIRYYGVSEELLDGTETSEAVLNMLDLRDRGSSLLRLETIGRSEVLTSRMTVGGFFNKSPGENGKPTVVVLGFHLKTKADVFKTLFHELVGHFGTRSIVGANNWDSFLDSIYKSSTTFKNTITDQTFKTWGPTYLSQRKSQLSAAGKKFVPTISAQFTMSDGSKRSIGIDDVVMRRLTDEYLALIAERLSRTDSRAKVRLADKAIHKRLQRFLKRVLVKLGLGDKDLLTQDILESMVLDSYTATFKTKRFKALKGKVTNENAVLYSLETNPDVEIEGAQDFDPDRTDVEGAAAEGIVVPRPNMSAALQNRLVNFDLDPVRTATSMGVDVAMIRKVSALREEGFAELNKNEYRKKVEKLGNKLLNSSIGVKLSALGKLPAKRTYLQIQNIPKGMISSFSERFSGKVGTQFSKLNEVQKEQLMKYMGTKNASADELNMSDDLIALAIQAKNQINELSIALEQRGMLDNEVFKENLDSYIATRYIKYIDQPVGSSKILSFQGYLKKKDNDLPKDIQAALGKIEDPAFLISETISSIGRDVAIFDMLEAISSVSKDAGHAWTLGSEFNVEHRGSTLTMQKALDDLELMNKLVSSNSNINNFDISGFGAINDQISELTANIEAAEERATDSLTGLLGVERDQVKQSLKDNYIKMPKDNRFGALRGVYVRKEIHSDLLETINIYSQFDDKSKFNEWFGPTGHLVKGHAFWKAIKVPLNIPSWPRNTLSNFALMDISSDTNSAQITKVILTEVLAKIQGNPSKLWTLAENAGAFGSTFASQELFLIRKTMNQKLKQRAKEGEEDSANPFSRLFPQLGDKFLTVTEVMGNGYGLLEGAFKASRMIIHIQAWEKQNSRKFEDLGEIERQAIIDEGIFQAHQAVFDYSKLPNFARQLRRYPFGAPFLSFTMLAFPQIIRSMALRPQKFIKYAALPTIMQAIFQAANPDVDDDDYDKLVNKMPFFIKDKSSVFLTPFKDDNGNYTYTDFGYILPWGNFVDQGIHSYNSIHPSSFTDFGYQSGQVVADSLKTFGMFGGPAPKIISAFLTGKDDFTGRDIIPEGAAGGEKFAALMTYTWSMSSPGFLSNTGTLGKSLDNLGISVPGLSTGRELDSLGNDLNTAGEVASTITGINIKPFNPEVSVQKNRAVVARQIRQLQIRRTSILKDPNRSDKAFDLRHINEEIIRLREINRGV